MQTGFYITLKYVGAVSSIIKEKFHSLFVVLKFVSGTQSDLLF